jgi:phospholipase/lecithinase/hemolysin
MTWPIGKLTILGMCPAHFSTTNLTHKCRADTVGPTLIKEAMDILFNDYGAALSNLYKAGARNFLLVNVPQMNKSPGCTFSLFSTFRCR